MNAGDLEKPDYSHWLKVKTWSAYEASCLLLGIEPFSLPVMSSDQSDEQAQKSRELARLKRIVDGAAEAGDFGRVRYGSQGETIYPPTSWKDWISWARQINLDCATELLDALEEARTDGFGVNEEPQSDKPSDKRRMEGLQAALAILKQKSANGELNDWQDFENCMRKAKVIAHIRENPTDFPECAKTKPKTGTNERQTIKVREPTLTKSFPDFTKDLTILAEYKRLTDRD